MHDQYTWPDDADGDVFRRLASSGFDFGIPRLIDFNVDFSHWPPSPEAIRKLAEKYGEVQEHEPTQEADGYLLFQFNANPTYELVVGVQAEVTRMMAPYGGWCESWGILHD